MSHAADARGSLRARYVAFAQRHAGGLRTLEGLLQSAAWLAPEGDTADFVLEAASALVGIMGLVNEHVLPRGALEPADAQHTGDAPLGSLLISVLHQLEVLLEMSAERTLGADGKWSVLAAVEALKAALRLTLVARHGGCVLVGDTAPSGCLRPPLPLSDAALAALCVREREERTLRALAAFRQRRTLSACGHAPGRATTLAADACDACSRVAPLRTPFTWTLSPARQQRAFLLTGESLRILRPVVYCLAVRRLGRRSWKPWLAALAMDFGSDALLQRVPLNADEEGELRRRRVLLSYYLLFSPAFEVTLQPPLRAVRREAAPIPVLGAVADKMVEVLESSVQLHAYTSSL